MIERDQNVHERPVPRFNLAWYRKVRGLTMLTSTKKNVVFSKFDLCPALNHSPRRQYASLDFRGIHSPSCRLLHYR